jgi:regulator of RNase E activity RraA
MVASHGNLTKIEINIPVNIGGIQINPGDLLHGDENGIIKIPTEIAKSVVKQSQIVREEESKIFETLHQKSLSLEELKDEFS